MEVQVQLLAPASISTLTLSQVEPQKRSLKAWIPELYLDNLYAKCYYFCQLYDKHFETAKVTSTNQISFTMFFLPKKMLQW